jgi:Tfp pilus assembly protein PilF
MYHQQASHVETKHAKTHARYASARAFLNKLQQTEAVAATLLLLG